jgi:putative PIN family toxin of toxin-antitoxin system
MRIVVDTNVWLDLLVFNDHGVAFLRQQIEDGLVEVLIDEACEAELERVLAYPLGRISLDAAQRAACMAHCRRLAKRAQTHAVPGRLPRCSDPDDQKFLEAAAAARAEFLITKDQALLKLSKRAPFRIVKPGHFVTGPLG